MDSWLWIALGLTAGIAAVWFVLQRKSFGTPGAMVRTGHKSGPVQVTRNRPRQHPQHYYGVSVQLGNNPCDAIRVIADERYLSEDAPQLPLPDCDRDECRCTMPPEDDRRAGYDRRGDSFSAYGNFEPDQHTQKRHDKGDRRDPA